MEKDNIPLLDSILQDFKDIFGQDNLSALTLNILVPINLVKCSNLLDMKINDIYNNFKLVLDDVSLTTLKCEIYIYQKTIVQNIPLDETALDALDHCDQVYFPYVYKLLKILVTLLVSIATAERSFSTLRLLKTWLRSNMGEERLNGLALLYIHKNMELNLENVLNRFARSERKRKLDFVL